MVDYNPKQWFKFIFRFHKSDTVRKLFPFIVLLCLYSLGVVYLEKEFFKLSDNSYVKNIPIMHNLLGFAISMLLVFRTNTAYDRWWEGRKLWGSLVNNSRNLALKLASMLEDEKDKIFFKKLIPSYAYALRNHLLAEKTRVALFDDEKHKHFFNDLDKQKHVPNQIALLMYCRVQDLYKNKKINGEQLIILNPEMQSFTDICGACERIKNTPIPYSYSVFIKKFIFIYIFTLPIGYVFSLGYYVIPVVAFIFYVLASLEIIAEEIEDPFGDDANDIPTDKISHNIHLHVAEIL